ncbi:uncharacterized protein ACB058_018936 [Synchiropus picturatus]
MLIAVNPGTINAPPSVKKSRRRGKKNRRVRKEDNRSADVNELQSASIQESRPGTKLNGSLDSTIAPEQKTLLTDSFPSTTRDVIAPEPRTPPAQEPEHAPSLEDHPDAALLSCLINNLSVRRLPPAFPPSDSQSPAHSPPQSPAQSPAHSPPQSPAQSPPQSPAQSPPQTHHRVLLKAHHRVLLKAHHRVLLKAHHRVLLRAHHRVLLKAHHRVLLKAHHRVLLRAHHRVLLRALPTT